MIEEWRVVDEFPELEVSNLGRVRKGAKILSRSFDSAGYWVISVHGTTRKVHRLVAKAFIPNPENLPFVNHKDENKANPNVENLEWCTHIYNVNYGTCQQRRSKTLMGHPKLGAAGRPMKPILQVLNGFYIGYYESCQAASKSTGVNDRHINECSNYKRKTAGGFQWVKDLDYSLLSGIL